MNKPDWMTDHEWETKLRDTQAQFDYDMYYAPEYIKKLSRIGAAMILGAVVLAIVGGLIGLTIELVRR